MPSFEVARASRSRLGIRAVGLLVGLGLALASTLPLARQASAMPAELEPELRELADRRPIRVGWPQATVVAPLIVVFDGEQLTGGYGYELWTLAGIQAKVQLEHVAFESHEEVVAALKAGTIDAVGMLGPRPDLVAFAEPMQPLVWERITLVGRTGESPAADLGGRRVTTLRDSPLESLLAREFPRAIYVPTSSPSEAFAAVVAGDVDEHLTSLSLAGNTARDMGLRISPLDRDLGAIPLGPWTTAGSPYAALIEAALSTLTSSQIAEATLHWTGFDLSEPRPSASVARRYGPVAAGLVATLLAVSAFALLLRRRVRMATAELRSVKDALDDKVRERTADLVRSNRALSDFSRSVAHDLRNPITVIAGMTHLLATREIDEQTRTDMLASIERSIGKLDDMIRIMLAEAVASGADVPVMDGPAYEGWLRDAVAVEILGASADLRVVVPDVPLDLDVPLLLKCSVNLVGNAAKYAINPGGTIVHVSLTRTDADWRLTVEDNGAGLPGSDVNDLFGRGVRGAKPHHTDDADARGQGWGLFDVREQLTAAGGSIVADRSALGGARFTATLPHVRIPSSSAQQYEVVSSTD